MSRYVYALNQYETVDEVNAAVTSLKNTLDTKPTTWCVVKPMINPRTIELPQGNVIGYDSGDPLTDAQINALNSSDTVYNVYSINDGDNFTEVAEKDVAGKVRVMRQLYGRWLRVQFYYDTENNESIFVTQEDMSGYV